MSSRSSKAKPTLRIFISHQWHGRPHDSSTFYELTARFLDQQDRFRWIDCSLVCEEPVPGPTRVARVMEVVRDRIRRSDLVILAGPGVYSSGRPWFQREVEVTRTEFATPKPLLYVRGPGLEWDKGYALAADAWAVFTRRSVVAGVESLIGLTATRRRQLLARAGTCPRCRDDLVALELNRLRGAYCVICGRVLLRLSSERGRWRRDRRRVYPPFGREWIRIHRNA